MIVPPNDAAFPGVDTIQTKQEGLVTRTHNRFYHIKSEGVTYLCSPKGIFRQTTTEYRIPVIGDRVEIQVHKKKQQGVEGMISAILPRTNRLLRADGDGRRERAMAANLDLILVVSAVAEPGVDFPMIDRYILSCQLARIPYRLVLNKSELVPAFVNHRRLDCYRDLGIDILETSAKTGTGLETLRKWVGSGVSYLTGTSGVGKSTLINCLVPGSELTTASVDSKKGRGRHTTTCSTLVPLPGGGYLVDSPGLRDFYPPKVAPEEVRFGYLEMAQLQSQCKFSSCLHDVEPSCAVRQAVTDGHIAEERYKSYLFLLSEMHNYAQNRY